MGTSRPTRWRCPDARRRSRVRRPLLWGGITGLAAGLVAQRAVEHDVTSGTEYEWLIRGALLLPAVVFFLWLALFSDIAMEEPAEDLVNSVDADERLERIGATFDSAAVPRARRTVLETVEDDADTTYRATVRRDADPAQVRPSSFGVGRRADRGDAPDVSDAAS